MYSGRKGGREGSYLYYAVLGLSTGFAGAACMLA